MTEGFLRARLSHMTNTLSGLPSISSDSHFQRTLCFNLPNALVNIFLIFSDIKEPLSMDPNDTNITPCSDSRIKIILQFTEFPINVFALVYSLYQLFICFIYLHQILSNISKYIDHDKTFSNKLEYLP